MAKAHRYYVYILKCSDSSYYTGVTNNIELRLKQHTEGVDPKSYTFQRRPVHLVYALDFKCIDKAIAFEKQRKGWSRKKKEAIIIDRWDDLKELARCKNLTSHVFKSEEG